MSKALQVRKFGWRALCIVALAILLIGQYSPVAAALSPDQKRLLREGILYYNVDSCGDSPVSNVSTGTGKSDGATFPNLNPTNMANGIDTFIKEQNPDSSMKGLGETIVASAKNANVSPFLITAIAAKESSMADPNDYNVSHGNNSFGREATSSQPHFDGAHMWYKWSSVKASVDYTAPENQHAEGGGDEATYLRNQYANDIDGNDIVGFFMEYAPPSENDTKQYAAQVKSWIDEMVKDTGSAPDPASIPTNSASPACSCPVSDSTTLTGSDNQEKIYNFFVGKGLSPIVSAAFVGNFAQESGWNPEADQPGGPGRGIAQWSEGDRWDTNPNGNVVSFAKQQGGSPTDLGVQLDFVWYELNHSFKSVLTQLQNTNDLDTAVKLISSEYEIAGIPQDDNRINAAKDTLKKFGGGAASDGASASGSGCSTTVNCNLPPGGVDGLTPTRQNVVCLAEQELKAWNRGSMKPGFRPNSQDSFSKYSQNSDELWCADFASWIYNEAGYPLQAGADWRVPAVQSIQSIGEQNKNFHWHPTQDHGYAPRPGDLAIYGGGHVNIVTKVQGSNLTVVGGDQGGGGDIYQHNSKVTEYPINGFDGGGITGYVSPD